MEQEVNRHSSLPLIEMNDVEHTPRDVESEADPEVKIDVLFDFIYIHKLFGNEMSPTTMRPAYLRAGGLVIPSFGYPSVTVT